MTEPNQYGTYDVNTPVDGSAIISVRNADKYYNRGKINQVHVMDNISIDLPQTGMVAVFGQSGCGKTTLLNALGGLDSIQSGSISIFGDDLSQNTDYLRNRYIGYIFQNYNLNNDRTCFENVADALLLCGMSDKDEIKNRVMCALRNVGMDKYRDRLPDTLSGGQQQRVAIARALVKRPAIILADEPTGNLDESNTILVMDILKEISQTCLVVLVTHEANLVDYYCDRVIEIVDGAIVGERRNLEAHGLVARDKNDIYLGELSCTKQAIPGLYVTQYGEPIQDVKIRLVTYNGKTYLVCDTPGVHILDETSEIHLRQGVFESKQSKTGGAGSDTDAAKNGDENGLDLSALTPFEGHHFGRLYTFKTAVSAAWNDLFRTAAKRKSKRFLRIVLILLSCVLVFITAAMGVGIKEWISVNESVSENIFYLPLDNSNDYSAVKNIEGTHGIDYVTVCQGYAESYQLSLRVNVFTSVKSGVSNLTATCQVLNLTAASDLETVCGSDKLENKTDILISTALADKLLESSTVDFVSDYEDLLGRITTNQMFGEYLRVTGIKESSELIVFVDDMVAAQIALMRADIAPESAVSFLTSKIADGTTVLTRSQEGYSQAKTITVYGMPFTVAETSDVLNYVSFGQYGTWAEKVKGEKLMTLSEWIEKETGGEYSFVNEARWLYEYYGKYVKEYAGFILTDNTYGVYDMYTDVLIWKFDAPACWFQTVIQDVSYDVWAGIDDSDTVYAAYQYYLANRIYPTDEQLATFVKEGGARPLEEAYAEEYKGHVDEVDSVINALYRTVQYMPTMVISDADYIRLSKSVGKSDEFLYLDYWVYEGWDGTYYDTYLMLHANNPTKAGDYLTKEFGNLVLTPGDIYEQSYAEVANAVTASVVAVIVITALMCLCVYFIMKATFMSRVKEIGILRAVGVSRKNLVFRFMMESLVLTTVTILVGFLLSSAAMTYLADSVLFSSVFYFPLWLAGSLLVILYALSVLFGILPCLTLLRRTPAQILAKYDI